MTQLLCTQLQDELKKKIWGCAQGIPHRQANRHVKIEAFLLKKNYTRRQQKKFHELIEKEILTLTAKKTYTMWRFFCTQLTFSTHWPGGMGIGSSGVKHLHIIESGHSLRNQIFFLLRTALKDRPKGPPTANHQLPPTASGDQPPNANHYHQSPTTNRRQPPPTANCHQPWLNTWSARGIFWENCVTEHFFFSVKDRPALNEDME